MSGLIRTFEILVRCVCGWLGWVVEWCWSIGQCLMFDNEISLCFFLLVIVVVKVANRSGEEKEVESRRQFWYREVILGG